MLAMEHSMSHVEPKVLTDNQDEEVASELPSIWGILDSEVPWDLPVVDPSGEGEA